MADADYLLPCFEPRRRDPPFTDADEWRVCVGSDWLLDLNSGYWNTILGHRKLAISATTGDAYFAHLFGRYHESAARLAAMLCQQTGYHKALLLCSGSGAVDAALRIAWQCTWSPSRRRDGGVLSLSGAYHGSTAAGLAVSGLKYERWLPFRTSQRVLGRWVFEQGIDPAATDRHLAAEQVVWDRVRAFLFEPVVGVGGVWAIDPSAYASIAAARHRAGGVCIADEIATGSCRTGTLLASERLKPTPDIVCLGKGLTNGLFPLSVVLVNKTVWER
jgi:adenosylmethionine-8-amino-7-oxononanoate aminotransferase